MDSLRILGKLQEWKGKLKEKYANLTDDDRPPARGLAGR